MWREHLVDVALVTGLAYPGTGVALRGLAARLHLDPEEVRSAARAHLLGPAAAGPVAEPQRRLAELRDGPRSPVNPWEARAWLEAHRTGAV